MSTKKKIFFIFAWLFIVIGTMWMVWRYTPNISKKLMVDITITTDRTEEYQLCYSTAEVYSNETIDKRKSTCKTSGIGQEENLHFMIPSNARYMKLVCGADAHSFLLSGIVLQYGNKCVRMDSTCLTDVEAYGGITSYFLNIENVIEGIAGAPNSYLVWKLNISELQRDIQADYSDNVFIIKIIVTSLILVASVWIFIKRKQAAVIPSELISSRRLIFDLGKSDFKTKYAASSFGTVWAFVQPIVTIAIYVFVFQVGFKAGGTVGGYPFLLYLVSGIIPWFFFAEAWMNASNCLVEYDYLVKKVVFKISVLPVVKIISSLFVHLFFILLAVLLHVVNGRIPDIAFVQIVYYLFCTICFALALSYFTAAITPFFKDISQIINIITQLGMWTIPIMYDEVIMGEKIMRILRYNPMYYVVTGYRDSFMQGEWFWNKVEFSIYFWLIVGVLFFLGFRTFRKMRVHFADVL